MNKKIMMTIGAMAIAAVLGLVFSQNLSVSAGPDLTIDDIKEKVQSQYPGEITELELDEKGKNPVYEVEIVIEGKEYELVIDGNSGEVLKLDEKLMATNEKKPTEAKSDTKAEKKTEAVEPTKKEDSIQIKEKTAASDEKAEKKSPEKQVDNSKTETAKVENKPDNKVVKEEPKSKPKESQAKKTIITEQEAINIALKQFSGNVEEVDLDKDDGRLIYEIEIKSSRGDAEIEIDAYTGKVLVVDIDLDDDDNDDD